jgi:hypothetical protein
MKKDSAKKTAVIPLCEKNGTRFKELSQSFLNTINNRIATALDTIIDEKQGTTVGDEVKEYITAGIQYGKAKLNKPTLDNASVVASTEEAYARINEIRAKTRLVNAEAKEKEISNCINEIKSFLELKKLMLAMNDDAIILISNSSEGDDYKTSPQ